LSISFSRNKCDAGKIDQSYIKHHIKQSITQTK